MTGNDSRFAPNYGAMFQDVKQRRRIVGIVVLVLWLASLGLPAATFARPGYEYVPGFLVAAVGLIFGWALLQFGAFANLILIAVVVTLLISRRPWVSLVLAMEILALTSFTWSNFPDDAGDNPITHFSSGFYVWQLAMVLPTFYVIWEWFSLRSSKNPLPRP